MTTSSSQTDLTEIQKWQWAFIVESLLLPPKILASYFCFYVIRNYYLDHKQGIEQVKSLLLVSGVLIVAILAHRAVSNYMAYPIVLGRPVRIAFWDPSFLVGSVVDSLLIIGIFVGLNFAKLQSKVARKEIQLHKEKLEAELHFLRAQINPHFLFNTLNNIYSLARKKSDLTPEAIVKLSKLMRFLLYEGTADRISLHKEVSLLEDYIALEKMRYPAHRLSLNFNKTVDDEAALIAPLILLTFVENAFKHGASESEGHTTININLTLKDQMLLFEVENSNHTNHNGVDKKIGLKNAERQLSILYRQYDLEIKPQEMKFIVKLNINLNSYGTIEVHHR